MTRMPTARRRLWAGALVSVIAAALCFAITPAAYATTPTVVSVTTGGAHSCALLSDGTAWCWGENGNGELGDGTTKSSTVPVRVPGLTGLIAVSAGYSHTCALTSKNRVWCWGSDLFGELGNGTTATAQPVPVEIPALKAQQISAGRNFTCAVNMARNVFCWGDNDYGELGDGNMTDASTPQHVVGLDDVGSVDAGAFHACATIYVEGDRLPPECWGDNTFGDLGDGTTTLSDVPVDVHGGILAYAISAGDDYTCALSGPGDLYCWGSNDEGQLGDGTYTDHPLPTQVVGMTSQVNQVSTGLDATCALVGSPATGFCWGDAGNGELGTGEMHAQHPVPVPVFGLSSPPTGGPGGPVQLDTAENHSCVLLTGSQVECWGEGSEGRLGNGTQLDHAIPTLVIGLPSAGPVAELSSGPDTSCALLPTFSVACWGYFPGDGSSPPAAELSPVLVDDLPVSGTAEVSAGTGGCVVSQTGSAKCWGANDSGQVGDGTTTDRPTPVAVIGLPKARSIDTNGGDACAVVTQGNVECWGNNDYGQLGDQTTTERSTPVVVANLPGQAVGVAVGGQHSCAVLANGTARCWGRNNAGQLGDGTTDDESKAVHVSGLSGVVQIAAGGEFTCALTITGAVDCWGDNSDGQLGNGTTTQSLAPTAVVGLPSGVRSITAGSYYACAVLQNEQVDCWGDNSTGELGNGTIGGFSATPAPVSGLVTNGAPLAATGWSFSSCAVTAQYHAVCWGDNVVGQLGNGTTTDSGTPVAVNGL